MNRIVLRLRADGGAEWTDASGIIREGMPCPQDGDCIVVLVPGSDVLLLEADGIPGRERQWSRALPYLVEERIVAPIETQRVAWSRGERPGSARVAVVANRSLDAWLSRLGEAGLAPDAMYSEALALPVAPQRRTLLVEPGRCVLRTGPAAAFSGTVEEVVALAAAFDPLDIDTWIAGEAEAPFPASPARRVDHALALLASADPDPAVDLLMGRGAGRGKRGSAAEAWRRAAMPICAAAVLALALPLLEGWMLAAKVEAQRAEMTALYRRAVPDADAWDHPEARLRSALVTNGLAGGDDAVAMLSRAAPGLSSRGISIESIEARRGRMEVVAHGSGVGELDALRIRLAGEGLRAAIDDIVPGMRGAQGRLTIEVAQ